MEKLKWDMASVVVRVAVVMIATIVAVLLVALFLL